jgi:hypothetical protein
MPTPETSVNLKLGLILNSECTSDCRSILSLKFKMWFFSNPISCFTNDEEIHFGKAGVRTLYVLDSFILLIPTPPIPPLPPFRKPRAK